MVPCPWTSSTLPVQWPNTLTTDALSRAFTSVEAGPILVSDLVPVWVVRAYGVRVISLWEEEEDVGNHSWVLDPLCRVSTQQHLGQPASTLSFW